MFTWLTRRNKNEDMPEFWQSYEVKFKEKPKLDLSLEKISFVVFDTETTGLDVRKDRILSIGAVRVQNWQMDLKDSLDCFVRQDYQINHQESITIHGILPIDRAENLDEQVAVEHFLRYIGNDILVGHHVLFDIGMVNEALKRAGGGKLKNMFLDTGYLANRVKGSRAHLTGKVMGLDELCQRYEMPAFDRHTAAGDAYLTAILLMKMLHQLQKRGVRNLRDLLH